MRRRELLRAAAGVDAGTTAAGCVAAPSGDGGGVEVSLTQYDDDPHALPPDAPPHIAVDGRTATVRGTMHYGAANCGDTIDVTHARYHEAQRRLDLVVAAVNEGDTDDTCYTVLEDRGYRVRATVAGDLAFVAASEHGHGARAQSTAYTVPAAEVGEQTSGTTE
ncbi:MAG: hypothetical protein ABEJ42_06960 [Halobacteriaceae archaeon]